VALVADYCLFASQKNGLRFCRVEFGNSINPSEIFNQFITEPLAFTGYPCKLSAVQRYVLGNHLMEEMLK